MRLFVAGLRQVLQPSFTAETIFEITDKKAFVVVQELGIAMVSDLYAAALLAMFLFW